MRDKRLAQKAENLRVLEEDGLGRLHKKQGEHDEHIWERLYQDGLSSLAKKACEAALGSDAAADCPVAGHGDGDGGWTDGCNWTCGPAAGPLAPAEVRRSKSSRFSVQSA